MAEDIRATYLLETPLALKEAAEMLAGEQSSGTFVTVPGESAELRARHRAEVEQVERLEPAPAPSLPGALPSASGRFERALVTVRFPLANLGTNLPVLVSTLLGNLFELRELSGVRLLDLELPEAFRDAYPLPQFGVAGTRRLAGVVSGPLLGTIVKPSVGLTPEATAQLVGKLAEAGLDFVKDDELMADPPHSPFEERVRAVMEAVNEHAERSGKRVMVAFNITGELDDMYRRHDAVLAAGGTCVMLSLNSVGFAAATALRRHSALPIHGHRNGWGMLSRHPSLGLDFRAYQKLWRLVGVDQLHVNGLANKFHEDDASVLRSLLACHTPLFGPGDTVLPVVSSGQTVRQVGATYRAAGTADLLFLAGGGVMAHPQGPAAGVTALRQAWDAALAGLEPKLYAETHPELNIAFETFGEPL